MVTYDPVRAVSLIQRAVDDWLDGLWDQVTVERAAIIDEAARLLDQAAELINQELPQWHCYVDDYDIAATAVGLALDRLMNWSSMIETVLYSVETHARDAHWREVLRGVE